MALNVALLVNLIHIFISYQAVSLGVAIVKSTASKDLAEEGGCARSTHLFANLRLSQAPALVSSMGRTELTDLLPFFKQPDDRLKVQQLCGTLRAVAELQHRCPSSASGKKMEHFALPRARRNRRKRHQMASHFVHPLT